MLDVEVLIKHYSFNYKLDYFHLRLPTPTLKSVDAFSNSVNVRGGGGTRNFAGGGDCFMG